MHQIYNWEQAGDINPEKLPPEDNVVRLSEYREVRSKIRGSSLDNELLILPRTLELDTEENDDMPEKPGLKVISGEGIGDNKQKGSAKESFLTYSTAVALGAWTIAQIVK